jgi:hypothetical protein
VAKGCYVVQIAARKEAQALLTQERVKPHYSHVQAREACLKGVTDLTVQGLVKAEAADDIYKAANQFFPGAPTPPPSDKAFKEHRRPDEA